MNRIKSLSVACLLAAAAFLTGCDKKEKQPEVEQQSEITVENEVALSQTVYADRTSGTSGVTIFTSGAWSSAITEGSVKSTKAGTATWASINPDHGNAAGTYTIVISLEPNATGEDRAATITITCNGEKITITVTQKGTKEDGEPYVEPEKSSECSIVSFIVDGVYWTINSSNLTITHLYPAGTDLSNLIPNIVYSERAVISPASGVAQDFSDGKPITYTVTAEDGTRRVYVAKADVEVNEKVKLLTREVRDGEYITYEYDAQDRLTKRSFYWGNGELVESFTLIYDDNDLLSFVYDYSERDSQTIYDFIINGNTITIPGDADTESCTIDLNADGYPAKFENESGSFIINYEYQGGNLTKMSSIEKGEGDSHQRSWEFRYDNKISPFYHCKTPKWFIFYLLEELGSQNNVIEQTVPDANGKGEYTYEFDSDGYPTKQTKKYRDDYEEREWVTLYEYK